MFDRLIWSLRAIRQMTILPLTEAQLRQQDEDIAHKICVYLSRGNVSAQLGRFTTAEKAEQRWQKTFRHRLHRG